MSGAAFCLSVDDGHPLDLRLASLLVRHGLRATFYLPMRNREGPPVLDAAGMRTLAASFDIGSHTHDHCYLTHLTDAAAWQQITTGKQALEQVIGRDVPGFCYPGGKFCRHHRRMVKAAGCRYARTTANLWLGSGRDVLTLPTTLQFYPHPRAVLLRNFCSQGHWSARSTALCRVLCEDDWQLRLYRLFDDASRRGGVFHLWCHTQDIERLALWKTLDQFLRFVARRVPAPLRLDNRMLAERVGQGLAACLPDHQIKV